MCQVALIHQPFLVHQQQNAVHVLLPRPLGAQQGGHRLDRPAHQLLQGLQLHAVTIITLHVECPVLRRDHDHITVHRSLLLSCALVRFSPWWYNPTRKDVFYMTFVERLTLISSLAALVSALAALFTAIAQVIIAKATNLSAYKLESEKMFFHAQVEAYESFFEAAQSFMSRSPDADAGRLTACCARAILFSSRDTCAKLSGFSSQLMEFQSNPTPESQKAFNASAYEAFEAMRQELLQMHHPLVERKHRT